MALTSTFIGSFFVIDKIIEISWEVKSYKTDSSSLIHPKFNPKVTYYYN